MIGIGRRHKVLAAAALWGACAWFVSLDVDFLVANLHNAPHWLLQLFRALFVGVSVAIGYAVYRKYLLEIRTRSEKCCATLNLKDSERAGQRNDRNRKKTQGSCRSRALGSVRLVRELGCGFPSGESSQRSALAAATFPCSVRGSERCHRLRGISQVSA